MKPHTYLNRIEIESIKVIPPRRRFDIFRKKSFWTGKQEWMYRGILGGEYPISSGVYLINDEPHIPYTMIVKMKNGSTHSFEYYTENEIERECQLLKDERFYSPI